MPFLNLKILHKGDEHKSFLKSIHYTLLVSTNLSLSITFPLLASKAPPPHPPTPNSIFLLITLWTLALTPLFFFLGSLIGLIYYHSTHRASNPAKTLAEQALERDKICARLSSQLLTPKVERDGDLKITTIDLRELQRPVRAASRFSGVREGMKKLRWQFGRRGRVACEDDTVLWDVGEYVMADMTTSDDGRIGEGREGSLMRWEQVGFEDIDLGTVGRVRVRSRSMV